MVCEFISQSYTYVSYNTVFEELEKVKLFYSQFEELESFAKFGTQMDKETANQLKRGRAIRAVMQQMQYKLMSASVQIAVFMATNAGLLDDVPEDKIVKAQEIIDRTLHQHFGTVIDKIVVDKEKLEKNTQDKMLAAFKNALETEGILTKQ